MGSGLSLLTFVEEPCETNIGHRRSVWIQTSRPWKDLSGSWRTQRISLSQVSCFENLAKEQTQGFMVKLPVRLPRGRRAQSMNGRACEPKSLRKGACCLLRDSRS